MAWTNLSAAVREKPTWVTEPLNPTTELSAIRKASCLQIRDLAHYRKYPERKQITIPASVVRVAGYGGFTYEVPGGSGQKTKSDPKVKTGGKGGSGKGTTKVDDAKKTKVKRKGATGPNGNATTQDRGLDNLLKRPTTDTTKENVGGIGQVNKEASKDQNQNQSRKQATAKTKVNPRVNTKAARGKRPVAPDGNIFELFQKLPTKRAKLEG